MKRIIALLLLVCFAAALSACEGFKGATSDDPSDFTSDTTVSDESGSVSEGEDTEDTGKSLFVSSLVGAIDAPTAEFPTFPETPADNGDIVLDVSLALDSLKNNGYELLSSDGGGLSALFRADTEEMREDCTVTFELSGEELGIRMLYDRTGMYVTDVLGLSKKFYKLAEVSDVEYNEAMMGGSYEEAFTLLLKVITDNIDESMFTLKAKSVKIDGVEYGDAQVLTLTIDDGTLRRICNEWVSEVKNSEKSGSLLSDADAEAIKKAVDGIKNIAITSNIVDGKCLSMSFESQIVKLDTRGNELAKKTNKGELIFTENGFDLQLKLYGLSDESFEDYLNLDIKYENVGNDFDITVTGSSLFGVPRDILTAEFTVDGGVLDGSFSILSGEELISFDLCVKGGSEQAVISLKNMRSTVDGVETADRLDAELTLSATDSGYGISAEFELAAGIEESVIEARGAASITIEYTDVEIDPPTTPLGELGELLEVLDDAYGKYENVFEENELLFVVISEMFYSDEATMLFRSDTGISIELPADFEENAYALDYYTVRWDNYYLAIGAVREDKNVLKSHGIFTAQQFLDLLHDSFSGSIGPITESDGLFYFEIEYFLDDGTEMKSMITTYVSDTNFWYIETYALTEYYDEYKSDIIEWMKSVKVFTPSDSSQGSDGDL
ncbi:MAG: hypothetical protein IKK70_04260 [Clostridia bacterium]|nr:hypothetical protein [Clostridia bacterium]